MSAVRIGTSGWSYPGWRKGVFYPSGLRAAKELSYLAATLNSAEINGSFYSLQRPATYRSWAQQTPDDFQFAVKGGRYITHMRRLRDVDRALANFFASGVLLLGRRLGPVLWQLPATFTPDLDLLTSFLTSLPRSTAEMAEQAKGHDGRLADRVVTEADEDLPVRHALELRNDLVFDSRVLDLLRRQAVALVISDGAGQWPMANEATADFSYVRLHGSRELYASDYTAAELRAWSGRVVDWRSRGREVFVYFDNDGEAHAPHNAITLRRYVDDS